ncbi:hypothetical protein ACNKHW_04855 [Shigella flexneri]
MAIAHLVRYAAHEAMALGIEKAHRTVLPPWRCITGLVWAVWVSGGAVCSGGGCSIHFVSVVGIPMVAPFHGRDSRFGTNPFCVVFPR